MKIFTAVSASIIKRRRRSDFAISLSVYKYFIEVFKVIKKNNLQPHVRTNLQPVTCYLLVTYHCLQRAIFNSKLRLLIYVRSRVRYAQKLAGIYPT